MLAVVGPRMENIQFEITHERLVALIAKHIDVPADQITLHVVIYDDQAERAQATMAWADPQQSRLPVVAVVRTDLATANKIDRKLKRLEGEPTSQE